MQKKKKMHQPFQCRTAKKICKVLSTFSNCPWGTKGQDDDLNPGMEGRAPTDRKMGPLWHGQENSIGGTYANVGHAAHSALFGFDTAVYSTRPYFIIAHLE